MTYLPTKPITGTATAGPLDDANLLPLTQAGVAKQATLATLKSFLLGSAAAPAPTGATSGGSTGTATGSTAPTGSTSTGSTASTGSTGGGTAVNPITSNSSPVARNTATAAAPVNLIALQTMAAPTVTAPASGESAEGTTLTASDGLTAPSGSIVTDKGAVLTLVNSGTGTELYCNGVNMHMHEGNYGGKHYPFPTTQLKWHNHQLSIRSPQRGFDDWYMAYGPDSSGNWNTCYINGEDPTLTDTYVIPTPPTGAQPYPIGVRVGNTDQSGYIANAAQASGMFGPIQFINLFTDFNLEWNQWAANAGYVGGNARNNSASKNMVPVVGIKLTRNSYGYYSEPEALEGETLDSSNYSKAIGPSLIFDNTIDYTNNSSGQYKPNHWQMDKFPSGQFGVAYYSEVNDTYTRVAGTDSPGVSRIVYTGRQVHYQDTGGSWHGPWNGSSFPAESNPLPSTYARVESYRVACHRDYTDVGNGVHDADITGVADAYHSIYPVTYWRIAYEFNGGFMPDYFGGNGGETATLPLWIAAFQRMATLIRASAQAKGVKAYIVWNPAIPIYTDQLVENAWPGDSYVDVIGLDEYSPVYNNSTSGDGLYDWSKADGTISPDPQTWMGIPENRIAYWDYGSCGSTIKNPTPPGLGSSHLFCMQYALNFVKSKGKSLMIAETGAGNDHVDQSNPFRGPVDDGLFPLWLRSRMDQAVNMGIPVIAVMMWCDNEGDGGWGCIGGERRRQAQAWSAGFGGTTAAALVAPGASSASGGSTASTGSTGATSGGSTASTGSTTGTGTSAATAVVKDTSGNTATLTLSAYKTYYGAGGGDTSLTLNIFYYLDTATNKPTIGSANDASIASIVITENGNNVTVTSTLAGVTTYSGATTGSTGATASSGSGPASAVVTDTNGKSSTLSLPNPPVTNQGTLQVFYGSDTGLKTNINWTIGGDGNLYLDGVTDSDLSSAVVTRNGLTTLTSQIPNTTYK